MANELANVGVNPLTEEFRNLYQSHSTPEHELPTDIAVGNNMYKLYINVAGVDKNQIKVSFSNHLLRVSVFKQFKLNGFRMVQTENPHQPVFRDYYLNAPDFAHTEANLENGLLTITVPQKETTSHNISIN